MMRTIFYFLRCAEMIKKLVGGTAFWILIFLLFILGWTTYANAATQYFPPSSAVNATGGGAGSFDWGNEGNITPPVGLFAYCADDFVSVQCKYLFASDYGVSIPGGETITNVVVDVTTAHGGVGSASCREIGVFVGGVPVDTLPCSAAFGGGVSSTSIALPEEYWDDITDSDFGIGVSAETSGGSSVARLYTVDLFVTSEAPTPPTPTVVF